MKKTTTLANKGQAPTGVALRRLVSLGHVAACVIIINAMGLIMAVLGIVGSETLAAALYWPWVTFVIVAMTSKPKANDES